MEDITNLGDTEKLEAFEKLDGEEILSDKVILAALAIEDEYTRQRAVMCLEGKARKMGQTRNFMKLVGILKQKLRDQSAGEQEYKTKLDGIDLTLNTGEWIVNSQGIKRFVNRNGSQVEEIACWQPIIISNIYFNQELNTYRVQLAFKESEYSRVKTVTVNKSIIANTSSITALADYGISITNQSAPLLVKYLNDIERLNVDLIPRNNAISRIGWVEDMSFVPYNSGICFDGETLYNDLYNAIKCNGSYDKWKEILSTENSLPARMVLGSTFASPLVGLLDTLPFFTHLWGNTGNGKSVALHLASSVWGNPAKLVQNLNGTAVALERLAGFFCNLPLCLDELQTLKKVNNSRDGSYDEILYKLGQGRGKSRGRKDGSIDRVQTWALSIITTGEEPITTDGSQGGAKNRVIDVYCKDNLFNSATKVIKTCHQNYGYAGKEFIGKLIEYITEHSVKPLSDMYDKLFEHLMKTNPTEKQAMAATMVTLGYVLMRMFIFDVSELDSIREGFDMLDEIRPLLLGTADINNVENFYLDLVSYISQNKHHFMYNHDNGSEHDPTDNRMEMWGKITKQYVYLSKQIFHKYCVDNNVNERKISKTLMDANLIARTVTKDGSSESSRPVKIGDMQVRCILLDIERRQEQLSIMEKSGLTPLGKEDLDAIGQLPF